MKKRRLTDLIPAPVLAIFTGGILIRHLYIVDTSIYTRQHDVSMFGQGSGHIGYIEYLMNNFSLPDFDPQTVWQFAHPPLHHFISAVWMKLMLGLGVEFNTAAESLQYLTFAYSLLIMYAGYRIFCLLGLKKGPLYIATAIFTFHPTFIYLSGSINNDCLSVLFITLAILFILKWNKDNSYKNIIGAALCVGLGLMTKLSVIVVCVPIAVLFVLKLIDAIRQKNIKPTILRYLCFGGISIPLGLWFPVYNNIRFGLPLLFVYRLDENVLQYIGDIPFLQRVFDFSPVQFSSVYEQWRSYDETQVPNYNENNPIIAALKSAIFGEYTGDHTFDQAPEYNIYAVIVFYTAALLAIIGFAAMIVLTVRKRSSMQTTETVFILIFYATMMISFYRNCMEYPFVCTQNFRYIPLTVLVGALYIGKAFQSCAPGISKNQPGAELTDGDSRSLRLMHAFGYVILTLAIIFCITASTLVLGTLQVT